MSVPDLQRQGRQAYKDADYAKALKFYDRALGRQQTVQLYDQRAAAHEKLKDLKAALKDAKRAINTGREDPTGYLRASKVLSKMKNPSVALEICAYGLKNVRHIGQGYEQLRKVHDELQQQVAPVNSVDPLTVLPRELALQVLEYLNFRLRIAVSRVSKGWHSFIRSESSLWQHLDLSGAKKRVPTRFISTAINTSKKKLTAAWINQPWPGDFDKVLKALVKHCPLESLTLMNTGLQGKNLIEDLVHAKDLKELRIHQGTEISPAVLREALALLQDRIEAFQCAYVKRVEFKEGWTLLDLPKLKYLDLTADLITGTSSHLQELIPKMPSLETIKLHSLSHHTRDPILLLDLRQCIQLRVVHLSFAFRDSRQLMLPPSVTHLTITGTVTGAEFWPYSFSTDNEEHLRLADLPNLQELHLALPGTRLHQIVAQLDDVRATPGNRPPLSQLRALSIRGYTMNSGERALHLLTQRTTELESLAITDCWQFEDQDCQAFSDMKHLRRIDLSATGITGAGVKDVLMSSKDIRELTLNECSKVGRDAIDWARSTGVKVHYKMSNDSANGKKVRY